MHFTLKMVICVLKILIFVLKMMIFNANCYSREAVEDETGGAVRLLRGVDPRASLSGAAHWNHIVLGVCLRRRTWMRSLMMPMTMSSPTRAPAAISALAFLPTSVPAPTAALRSGGTGRIKQWQDGANVGGS